MADAVHIKHAFVSTKPDSPDTSLVSSSEWNASLVVTGGTQGQLVARDAESSTGVSYIDRPFITAAGDSHSGSSPSGGLSDRAVTVNGIAYIVLMPSATVTTSGGATSTVQLRENGVNISGASFVVSGAGITGSFQWVLSKSTGTYTYDMIVTASSGTFTAVSTILAVFAIGVA
jgi:hypothetical protein